MVKIDRKQEQAYFSPADYDVFDNISKVVLDFIAEKGEDPSGLILGKREMFSSRKDCTEKVLNFMGIPLKLNKKEYSMIKAV